MKKKEPISLFNIFAENLTNNELGLKTKNKVTAKHEATTQRSPQDVITNRSPQEQIDFWLEHLEYGVEEFKKRIKDKDYITAYKYFYGSVIHTAKTIDDKLKIIYESES